MTNYEVIKIATIEEIERLLHNVYIDGFIDGRENNERFFFDKKWLCSPLYYPISKFTS